MESLAVGSTTRWAVVPAGLLLGEGSILRMEHRFFHADTFGRMSPDQRVSPAAAGLSRFGQCYIDALTGRKATLSTADQREVQLEQIRQAQFPYRASRFVCLFAALSVDTAVRYTRRHYPDAIASAPATVKIYEVFAERYHVLDMLWLDLTGSPQEMLPRFQQYWAGQASYDSFNGVWREPMLEALLVLPARVGAVVHEFVPEWGAETSKVLS